MPKAITRCFALFAAIAIASIVTPSSAQTVYGQGGLFLHPSALVRPAGSVNFGVSYYTQNNSPKPDSEWNPFSLAYGASTQLEVGLTAIHHRAPALGEFWNAGPFARFQLWPDSPTRPAVGFATSNIPNEFRQTTISGVVSHQFGSSPAGGITLHTGVEWVRTSGNTGHQSDAAGFIGIQIPVARNLGLIGETSTKLKFERTHASAAGLIWTPPGGFSLAVGWVNNGRSNSNEFFVGAGYPIGGAK